MFHEKHKYRKKLTQLNLRRRHQISFRRFLSLDGGGDAIAEFLDMNVWELREYLSLMFEPGMSWENYKKEWVVDHIVPLKYFDAFNWKQMRLAWHHYNLRPEWLEDNHDKATSLVLSVQLLKDVPDCVVKNMLVEHVNGTVKNMVADRIQLVMKQH